MPDQASALKSVRMIDLLVEFFGDGNNWTRGGFHNGDGARCLVGAMQHVRAVHRLSGDPTRQYLLAAMPRNWRFVGLMGYNDHCREFLELLIVLNRARYMALCDAYGLPIISPAVTQQDSASLKAAARRKQRAAMVARWKLITDLERERKSPVARRITADTYILSPRAPVTEPQRLAA